MADLNPGPLQLRFSERSNLKRAKRNLTMALTMFDQGGEAGLHVALDRIYGKSEDDCQDTPDEMQREWLTRHFDSPLSPQEQLAKPRSDPSARQFDLFADAPPDVPGVLFDTRKVN